MHTASPSFAALPFPLSSSDSMSSSSSSLLMVQQCTLIALCQVPITLPFLGSSFQRLDPLSEDINLILQDLATHP
jgi:hypothetical protein